MQSNDTNFTDSVNYQQKYEDEKVKNGRLVSKYNELKGKWERHDKRLKQQKDENKKLQDEIDFLK